MVGMKLLRVPRFLTVVALVAAGCSAPRSGMRCCDCPPGARAGDVCVNPIDGAELVWVPAGEFLMGMEAGPYDGRPERRVHLDGFWIYKHEVTVAQYRKFCAATGRDMPRAPSWGRHDDDPIVHVTWRDAADYAAWAGTALPTEAQWEKAARGTDGRQYPWGWKWDDARCNTWSAVEAGRDGPLESGKGYRRTRPVGSYPDGASPYGCLDMAGNVWEWCADWYDADYYREAPASNPPGPATGDARVIRGGSCYEMCDAGLFLGAFRCAGRYMVQVSSYHNLDLGFRCAVTP